MSIDPEKFGMLQASVEHLTYGFKQIRTEIKKGIADIHERIDKHMEKEEEEQVEMNDRLKVIEKKQFEFQTKVKIWAVVLIAVATLIAPIARDLIYLWLFDGEVTFLGQVIHFLTYIV